jgi:hypothetical protein
MYQDRMCGLAFGPKKWQDVVRYIYMLWPRRFARRLRGWLQAPGGRAEETGE